MSEPIHDRTLLNFIFKSMKSSSRKHQRMNAYRRWVNDISRRTGRRFSRVMCPSSHFGELAHYSADRLKRQTLLNQIAVLDAVLSEPPFTWLTCDSASMNNGDDELVVFNERPVSYLGVEYDRRS